MEKAEVGISFSSTEALLDSWDQTGLILQCLGAVQKQWEQGLGQVLRDNS